MKVFVNVVARTYAGGLCLVAANTVEEARQVVIDTFPDEINMYDVDGDECFSVNECVREEHWTYRDADWKELPGVYAEYDKPTFLIESSHCE